jgi:hypothetical protein
MSRSRFGAFTTTTFSMIPPEICRHRRLWLARRRRKPLKHARMLRVLQDGAPGDEGVDVAVLHLDAAETPIRATSSLHTRLLFRCVRGN